MDAARRSNWSSRQPRILFCSDCQRLTVHLSASRGGSACGYCGAAQAGSETGSRQRGTGVEPGADPSERIAEIFPEQDGQ